MFSGLMYCHDCGSKMYFCTAKDFDETQNWFTCSKSRKSKDECSSHFIREMQVGFSVLKNMQTIFRYIQYDEERFAEMLLEKTKDDEKKERSSKRRELEKAHKRIDELNNLFFGHTRITYQESLQTSGMSFSTLPMRMREKNSMREYLFLKKNYRKGRNRLLILRNS